jgi:beta-glucosidase
MNLSRHLFGQDFSWGVSTAAYQIEGAYATDGKGASIWDDFTQRKRVIANNHNGKTACDFYNRYSSDIALLHQLHIPNYRFSLSWSRIFPHGTGVVNHKGIDFYNQVIDVCLELGIEPWVTLYHWDLPLALQKKGGWVNRDIVHWFGFFAEYCARQFGDRVKHWMVLNEPMVFTGAGYFLGVHAPGKKGLYNFFAAAHHAAICQAEGARIIKHINPQIKVGTTFSYSHIDAFSANEKDSQAAKKVDALLNRMFIEPLLGMGYPVNDLKVLQKIERFIKPGDEAKLKFDMDFIGLQNYTRELVKHTLFTPFVKAKIVKANKRGVPHTLMNWEVYPESIYHALKRLGSYRSVKEIVITENGAAFADNISTDNKVYDLNRILFLQHYLAQVLRAKNEGINVSGYFIWTLLDNFEWAEGFHPRFGLVHVDFKTQQRIIKESGYWYRDFIRGFGE